MSLLYVDTNVWLDFWHARSVSVLFRLPHQYCCCAFTSDLEYKTEGLKEELLACGLQEIIYTLDEYYQTESYAKLYPALSVHDALALAVAKSRNLILVTGDKALRNAGRKEGVEIRGSLWLFDSACEHHALTDEESLQILQIWLKKNGKEVRLPLSELTKRSDCLKSRGTTIQKCFETHQTR